VRPSVADAVIATVAVLTLAAPMLFTRSGFNLDFTNHLWLTWVAGRQFFQTGEPSYFLNTTAGVFYPMFAFYGGTLYTVTGTIGELLGGDPILAYVGVTTLAVASAYCGTLWLARQLGVQGLIAHAPALVVITSAYYVTDLYGRGAWPELVAISAIPPAAASGLHLTRAAIWRRLPMLVFVVSVVIFTGSHNLTLLWGTAVTAVALFVAWLASGAPRALPYRRVAALGGLGVASVLVNAWFLFPDFAYAHDVAAGNESVLSWSATSFLSSPAVLLYPLRHVPARSSTPALFLQIPDWFLAWGLLAGLLLLWRGRDMRTLRRAWVGVCVLVAALLGMIMIGPFWTLVPFPFDQIEFPYRLDGYVSYAVAGVVMAGALALQRTVAVQARPASVRWLRVGLAAVVAISVELCVWQEWVPSTRFSASYANRADALGSVNVLPASWYDDASYRDVSTPLIAVPEERLLVIPPRLVHGDRFSAWMNVPSGSAPIRTNISGGPYLVHIEGLERVGRRPAGEVVVKRPDGGSAPVHVVIETADGVPIELGRAVSLVALLLILAGLSAPSVPARRARRVGHLEGDLAEDKPTGPAPAV
jgi:hypothetical protein